MTAYLPDILKKANINPALIEPGVLIKM